ncbi:hypothetical protein [Edaphovirga cremea]|uniref:hypothetical protein n=1 Tax=Edaphovirga cremea TaxID=2267246 RepID=UPI00398A076B
MTLGYWIIKGDRTSCGGSVLEGHPKGQKFGSNLNPQAVQGNKVVCTFALGLLTIEAGGAGMLACGVIFTGAAGYAGGELGGKFGEKLGEKVYEVTK